MNCDEIRDRLMTAGGEGLPEAYRRHLAGCAACSGFARRVDLARDALRRHQAEHLPDPYFAQRVSALAGAGSGSDSLGWAAMRLLPVTLALVLVMTAWCWLATPGPSELLEISPTEDLLSWALEGDGS